MTFNYEKKYDANIDYDFFEQVGVRIKAILPWQFKLEHPDMVGNFVWYPERGSLIYEKPEWGISKVGEFTNSEDIWNEIKKKLK